MTRIDFYLTRTGTAGNRDITVCKLTYKAFRLGHRVYILTAGSEESRHLDRLLWTFDPGSFIPHRLQSDSHNNAEIPVMIGEKEPPEHYQDVLISLTVEVPEFFSRFGRVADVVNPTAEAKQRARARFKFYRENGYEVQAHNL
jgi:DNA polymerase-3 subunit chi